MTCRNEGLSRWSPTAESPCRFIGCLHLGALCGSPGWGGGFQGTLDRCLREAEQYVQAGVDGLILENTHDVPYQRRSADTGSIVGVALCAFEVRRRFDAVVGVQVLAGANVAAVDVAATCALDFIRAEGFVFSHVGDEGWFDSDAAEVMRRRTYVGAEAVEIWADIKKKHSSHAVTADLTLRDCAEAAVYFGVDGVVVTGSMTGKPPQPADVASAGGLGVRVVVGSGVDEGNIGEMASVADVLIVGSACKEGGDWRNPVAPERVRRLVGALRSA